jgi:thiol-disulfide isomerase/thioredoxin
MGEDTSAFRLYPAQTPKGIDLTGDGETIRGIYKLNGDTLTISLAFDSRAKVRPVDFDGGGVPVVYVLKKTKAPEGSPPKVLDLQPPKPPADEPAVVFENSPGWTWYEAPHRRDGFGRSGAKTDIFDSGYSYFFEEDKDGALLVYLAFSTNKSVTSYRPVIFDADRKRYSLTATGGLGHRGVSMTRFRLDPQMLPANKADYLGIEILTAKGRKLLANEAFDRARKSGAELLSFPEIGAVYDFVLTTADSRIIRSKDLRGKVVLIDCWATWCSPCMAKMPQLKEMYEQHQKDGLEIVGVCFDQDADKARKAIQSKGLNWPQVLVPADGKMRGLWQESSGIEALPRLLLLDRSGILRVDCGPGDLKEQIDRLLKETENPASRR